MAELKRAESTRDKKRCPIKLVLEVSPEIYADIRMKLEARGYGCHFHDHSGGELIDLHGFALRAKKHKKPPVKPAVFKCSKCRCEPDCDCCNPDRCGCELQEDFEQRLEAGRVFFDPS